MRKEKYAVTGNQMMPHLPTIIYGIRRKTFIILVSLDAVWFDIALDAAYLVLRFLREVWMTKPPRRDSKSQALAREGTLNPHPETVRDPLFTSNSFFDPHDLVQVRYEMVRRFDAEGTSITDVAASFGVSRPTFYKAQNSLAASGLAGLVPRQRGPKEGHKISSAVMIFVTNLKLEQPALTTSECLAAIKNEFGVTVHRRSLERALARKKKPSETPP